MTFGYPDPKIIYVVAEHGTGSSVLLEYLRAEQRNFSYSFLNRYLFHNRGRLFSDEVFGNFITRNQSIRFPSQWLGN